MSSKDFFEEKNPKQLCKFLALPDSDAQKIEIRHNLVVAIKKIIDKNDWTHHEAGNEAGVGRNVITAVVNGNLAKVFTDRLIEP